MAFYCFSMSNHAEAFPAVCVAVHHNTTVCLEMNKCKKKPQRNIENMLNKNKNKGEERATCKR